MTTETGNRLKGCSVSQEAEAEKSKEWILL